MAKAEVPPRERVVLNSDEVDVKVPFGAFGNEGRLVSVVIPTRNRPQLVVRAVNSALAQSYANLEVVVVVDGPDAETTHALELVGDERLRVIVLPSARGGANARNAGSKAARGGWIAFLDDDDEWLPEKIELQMNVALTSRFLYPIVGCQYVAKSDEYELIWPRKTPSFPISEYMLARNSLSMGEGHLSTITLLLPKEVFAACPFNAALTRCHEVDWVLRALGVAGTGIEFVNTPLAVAYHSVKGERITAKPDWRASLDWVESVRSLVTDRAYSSYLAITVSSQASRAGEWRAFLPLLNRMTMGGKPKARDLMFFFGAWFVPRWVQLAVRRAGW